MFSCRLMIYSISVRLAHSFRLNRFIPRSYPMKILQMSLCAVGIFALSACANTLGGIKADSRGPNDPRPVPTTSQAWAGFKADIQDMSDWSHNKPSALGDVLGPMPTAYAKKKSPGVLLKPPTQTASGGSLTWRNVDLDDDAAEGGYDLLKPDGLTRADRSLVWKERGQLDAPKRVPLPLVPQKTQSVEYNVDVTVFPVDGDVEPYPMVEIGNASGVDSAIGGNLTQQIFFGYGSSSINRQDSQNIRQLLQGVMGSSAAYSFNVVGHADKRVNNVKDPIKRKMINFAMAQERADTVTRELAKAGVAALQVTVISRGDEESNQNPGKRSREAADRRVDVYVDER